MKKIITSTAIGVVFLSTAFASALESGVPAIPFSPEISTVSVVREEKEYNLGSTLESLKRKGRLLITQRINALTSNKTIITSSKLTETQKSSIVAKIDDNVTRLNTLGTTIASSTDATSTKALVASIYTDFRVYGIVIPQIRLEKRIYDLENHATKLSELFIKTQTQIDDKKAKGYDVTTWQKSLDDSKVLVANDLHKLSGLKTQVLALTPASYGTTSKATIESVNKGLREVSKDFNSIRKLNNQGKFLSKIKAKLENFGDDRRGDRDDHNKWNNGMGDDKKYRATTTWPTMGTSTIPTTSSTTNGTSTN